jgi:hypothetical protein
MPGFFHPFQWVKLHPLCFSLMYKITPVWNLTSTGVCKSISLMIQKLYTCMCSWQYAFFFLLVCILYTKCIEQTQAVSLCPFHLWNCLMDFSETWYRKYEVNCSFYAVTSKSSVNTISGIVQFLLDQQVWCVQEKNTVHGMFQNVKMGYHEQWANIRPCQQMGKLVTEILQVL